MNLVIRTEKAEDFTRVHAVNELAFDTPAEANLVEELRKDGNPLVSLVAEEGGEIVGHILFSPVTLSGHPDLKITGLGPVAVLPERQGEGIGSALIREGLDRCEQLGFGAVIVLGHKSYYPRFGFTPSVKYSIKCEFDVPPEAFMVIELIPGYLRGAQGTIHYHPAYKSV